MKRPNLECLVDAAVAMARAIGYEDPDRGQTATFLVEVLFESEGRGGRNLWASLGHGLVTRAELRDALLDRLGTHFALLNGSTEPVATELLSEQLQHSFEFALFGERSDEDDD